MKIIYLSDLHLDMHQDGGAGFISDLNLPEHDLVAIAGDFSEAQHWRWKQNIEELCNKSTHVLYVLGNHEYYSSSMEETDCKAHKLTQEINNLTVASKGIVLTNKELPFLNDLTILAGTLWFQDSPDQVLYKRFLNDFSLIERLEPEIYNRNKRFDELLYGIKDEPSVVITHHMPSYKSADPKFMGSCINRFFVGAEFSNAIQNSSIRCWIHGHSHIAVDYMIGNTRITSNPVGYPWEISPYWQPFVIDVPTKAL
jgi:predicted MPP superfamily phosphohydrolase